MIPLMPSPGSPNIVSTPHSLTVSSRMSDAVSAMVVVSRVFPNSFLQNLCQMERLLAAERVDLILAAESVRDEDRLRTRPAPLANSRRHPGLANLPRNPEMFRLETERSREPAAPVVHNLRVQPHFSQKLFL